jgi:glycosyltransferase involved in cell wall biosynthesis
LFLNRPILKKLWPRLSRYRSKSNLKFLEFSSNKITCVCSNVENYANTVIHGETGLLADNNFESWKDNLLKLMNDDKYRKDMGQKGYDFVKQNYSIDEQRYEDRMKCQLLLGQNVPARDIHQ